MRWFLPLVILSIFKFYPNRDACSCVRYDERTYKTSSVIEKWFLLIFWHATSFPNNEISYSKNSCPLTSMFRLWIECSSPHFLPFRFAQAMSMISSFQLIGRCFIIFSLSSDKASVAMRYFPLSPKIAVISTF